MTVSALVMGEAPSPRLRRMLGVEGCERLEGALRDVALAWAREVAPGRCFAALGEGVSAPGVECFAAARGDRGERIGHAADRVFREHSEPVIVVGTAMPLLARAHARETEAVLRGGADLVLAPDLAGGFWLAGLARPAVRPFDLGAEWEGTGVLAACLGRAEELGLQAELLAPARVLRDPADARALAGHPDLPPAVAAALVPAGPS